MKKLSMNSKSILIFLALTFGATWLTVLVPYFMGVPYGSSNFQIILVVIMFIPAIGSIATRFITGEKFINMRIKPNFRGNIFKYILAAFLPAICIITGAMVFFMVYPGSLDPLASNTVKALAESLKVDEDLARGTLYGQLLIAVLISPIVNVVVTLGEELGWRGFLLPKLCNKFGIIKAMIISGIIWGIWHAPIIAMGHNYGTDYPPLLPGSEFF